MVSVLVNQVCLVNPQSEERAFGIIYSFLICKNGQMSAGYVHFSVIMESKLISGDLLLNSWRKLHTG